MIQALGSVLIAAGAVWAGLSLTAKYRAQVRRTQELVGGLILLEQELALADRELEVLGETVGARSAGAGKELFSSFAKELSREGEEPLAQIWRECVLELDDLPTEAGLLLLPLGEVLGRYESEEQRRCIGRVRSQLEALGDRLHGQCRTNCRLSQTAALSGGAFLIILLL